MKVNKPKSIKDKTIEIHLNLFNAIDNLDAMDNMQYDSLVADIIRDYFSNYSIDDIFPDGWYELFDTLDSQVQRNLYKDLKKILHRIQN